MQAHTGIAQWREMNRESRSASAIPMVLTDAVTAREQEVTKKHCGCTTNAQIQSYRPAQAILTEPCELFDVTQFLVYLHGEEFEIGIGVTLNELMAFKILIEFRTRWEPDLAIAVRE